MLSCQGLSRANDAKFDIFPAVVSLQLEIGYKTYVHYCGGTLLQGNMVITSAVCRQDDITKVIVVASVSNAAAHSRQSFNIVGSTRVYKQIIYPTTPEKEFVPMLLVLLTSFPTNNGFIAYARVPALFPIMDDVYIILGYGGTKEDELTSNQLRFSYVKAASVNDLSSPIFLTQPSQENFTNICPGDQGGPVLRIITKKGVENFIIYGVVNYIEGGCSSSVLKHWNTNIMFYIDWIKCLQKKYDHF